MRIRCSHGYFFFWEEEVGEISRFASNYGLKIVPKDDYYTFESLVDAPTYSLENQDYLGATAIVTYEGNPWDVMRQNKLIYDFANDQVVPIDTIPVSAEASRAPFYFYTGGLLLPGSKRSDGVRVTDYSAHYVFSSNKFRYTEVIYDENP